MPPASATKIGIQSHAIGGTTNHIHMLLQIPPALSVAEAVRTIKANSSLWSRREMETTIDWQQGYGAFGVCQAAVPSVIRYIETQEAHHKKIDFDAEFVALFREHGIEFDPKYVFG